VGTPQPPPLCTYTLTHTCACTSTRAQTCSFSFCTCWTIKQNQSCAYRRSLFGLRTTAVLGAGFALSKQAKMHSIIYTLKSITTYGCKMCTHTFLEPVYHVVHVVIFFTLKDPQTKFRPVILLKCLHLTDRGPRRRSRRITHNLGGLIVIFQRNFARPPRIACIDRAPRRFVSQKGFSPRLLWKRVAVVLTCLMIKLTLSFGGQSASRSPLT